LEPVGAGERGQGDAQLDVAGFWVEGGVAVLENGAKLYKGLEKEEELLRFTFSLSSSSEVEVVTQIVVVGSRGLLRRSEMRHRFTRAHLN
jgi:hypothetical protein